MSPLEDLEKLRNGFLAMVSHELRAPLTTIKGCASMALSADGAPGVATLLQYFRMIDQQSDHLNNLVNNLLDITQIESGTLSVAVRSEDVESIIGEARTGFLAQGSRNSVEVGITENLVRVGADRQRIVQVLHNLLSNASKFSEQDSAIEVTASRDEFSARISVADSGRGITGEELPCLFKKFSRINGFDEGRSVGGRGLGLAICKGIVEAHGGRIWAESRGRKQGTTFTFTIPLANPVREPTVSNSGLEASGAGRKILAVDDEPQVLWLLRKILSEHGFKTVETGNTEDLIALIEEERPHLVLMDLLIPGTSGLEQMKRIHRWHDVPVIFISGNDEEENIVRALKMGAQDYIVKPFSPSELVARIELVLRRHEYLHVDGLPNCYRTAELTIDYKSRKVVVSDRLVPLSATEYKLLSELSTNAGRILTHDQLLERVWGKEYFGETQVLRATVKNLRRKLGDDARDPKYVFTEPRIGYLMRKS